MVSTPRGKAVDKQDICKKILTLLRKHYSQEPKPELPVLETLLYAVCLENAGPVAAEQAYARMLNGFHDLNEVRVSSIQELRSIFEGLSEPEWRALRLRNILQYVFESTYSFDFDGLKRKPSDQAAKILTKIPSLTGFVRSFVTQNALGTHVLPVDQRMHAVLVWLGLADGQSTPDHDGEALRSFIRKADAQSFCHLLRCLATDPKYQPLFTWDGSPLEIHADEAVHRLEVLFKQGTAAAKKLDAARLATQAKEQAAERAVAQAASDAAREKAAAKDKLAKEKAAKAAEAAKSAEKDRSPEKVKSHDKDKKPAVKPVPAGKAPGGKAVVGKLAATKPETKKPAPVRNTPDSKSTSNSKPAAKDSPTKKRK